MTKLSGRRKTDNEGQEPVSIGSATADDLKTRTAWLYYMEGKTQDEIAQIIGTNRSKVLRILAQARADGTVQIRVTSRLSRCVELEGILKEKFALSTAIVVPSPQDQNDVPEIIGRELGAYLSNRIERDMTIGLGWGRTLTTGVPAIEQRASSGVSVISMIGSLTKVSSVNPSDFAWRVADRLAAECYMIAAPVFAPDAASRQTFMSHHGIAEVVERARRLDLAVVSTGDLSPESIFTRYGLLSHDEVISLERAGAVGDVLCRFIDAEGRIIDHAVNDRTLAVHPADLAGAREVVLASGGWSKLTAIRASIKLLEPEVLITDSVVAERLAIE